MLYRIRKGLGNTRGFTLLEFVVVIALAAVVMASAAILITKGKESAAFSSTNDNLQIIQAGLAERKVLNPNMPLQASSSTTWPAALGSYIPADLRAGGTYPHGYQCVAATNQITITTPVLQDADQAGSVLQRLIDNKACTSSSVVSGSNAVQCILVAFDGSASCQ